MIRKAVFPVGGIGSRFLPATKASPKEMLPIVDKPLIQYAAEEAVSAGITQLIFVTNHAKRAIEDHFDTNAELEMRLREKEQFEQLFCVQNILPKNVSCAYVRQKEPLGLGHAVLCAKPFIGDEPFAVLLADDLIDHSESCLQQMIREFQTTEKSIIAVEKVKPEEVSKYGIVGVADKNQIRERIEVIIEKPEPELAPSNLAVVGRYILTPAVLDYLENLPHIPGKEIQLTDAISNLIQIEDVYAYQFQGTRFDCGNKLGYLQATLHYGLKHPETAKEFEKYLQGYHQISRTLEV